MDADSSLGFDLDAEVVDLISSGQVEVPPFPAVAVQLIALTGTEDFGLDEVAKLITADQVLTASVLRSANSAFFAGSQPATSVLGALQRIGTKNLVGLALADALKHEATRKGPLSILRRSIWMRGVTSAFVAQMLATHHGVSSPDAFLCGLLHDFGELVALSCIEALLAKHPEAELPEAEWMGFINRYHVELGMVTAAKWQLPGFVVDAISSHHGEAAENAENPQMAELLICCDELVPRILAETHLTEVELSAIPGVTRADLDVLLRSIPQIPSLLANFTSDAGAAGKKVEPSSVQEPPAGYLKNPTRAVDFPVKAKLGAAGDAEFRAVQLSPSGLKMHGTQVLEERRALEVDLVPAGAPPLHCWVQVQRCTASGSEFELEVSPFAMDRAKAKQWRAIFDAQATPVPVKTDG